MVSRARISRVTPLVLEVAASDEGVGGYLYLEAPCRTCKFAPDPAECRQCGGTGVVPTEDGRRLLGFLRRNGVEV